MGASESRAKEENGETRESSGTALANESRGTALAAGAIAGVVLLALGAVLLALGAVLLALGAVRLMGDSSKSSEEENMKAPGRDKRINRRRFEENPADYFRDLHSDQRKK